MTGPSPREAGFTIVEMLVALAIAGLLSAALVGMIRFATATWERSAAGMARTDALVRADRTLRRQLAATVPAGALGEAAGRPPLFFGAADGFGWVARTPSAAARPGLYGQRVRSVAGRGLILESWRLDDPGRVETAPLLADEPVRFAYFGADGPAAPPTWHERWPAGPIPPRLVRIRPPRAAALPDLVYALP